MELYGIESFELALLIQRYVYEIHPPVATNFSSFILTAG